MERIIAITPAHIVDPQIAIAACRAGELGILDLAAGQRSSGIDAAVEKTARFAGSNGRWGIRWDVRESTLVSMRELTSLVSGKVAVLLLAGVRTDQFHDLRKTTARVGHQAFLEVNSSHEVFAAQAAGFDGCVVKGCEAGGWVGRKSSFILLQELHQKVAIPYWIQGGVGLHTAAAAKLAGAAGVVLCEQLWLTREGPFDVANAAWRLVDGSETVLVGDDDVSFRLFSRSGRDKLRELERESASQGEWGQSLARSLRHVDHDPLVPAGQDIGLAPELARKFGTTGRVISGFRRAMDDHLETARTERPLAAESGLARAHGTRYPIVQGPMTRVSDVVPFAEAVAEAGGLPFFALAVMRGPAVRELLLAASETMRDVPWGVGILGFVPLALRQEQLEIIREVGPPFAIISGGRPSQARELEALGIATYLHVPSPGLLKQFLKDGARKFIFEGSECGGHVGPRTSFVLWNLVVDTLLDAGLADPSEVHVLFAGGIHDALSGAMLSCVASRLAETGMQVGVLMGSGYLFTQEAVASGAIIEQYQSQAIKCDHTVVLRSSIGYATRCADTPFCHEFNDIRRQLLLEDKSNDEMTETLERLNLGRLRIASKGVMRTPDRGLRRVVGERYMDADQGLQLSQGMYMMGDVVTLRSATSTIAQFHEAVSKGSERLLLESPVPTPSQRVIRNQRATDVAIVGMACLFPGATSARILWQNILNRVDAVSEVTDDRWPAKEFFDPDRTARDKIYSKSGGFLEDIQFDPTRYGIPPNSLRSIEPIQLIALEVARLALEDAGFDHLPFPHERTAVIFAAGGMSDLACDYIFRTQLMRYLPTVKGLTESARQHILDSLYQQLPEWTEDSFPGILGNVVAGRIANRLNLGGSNFTVDAACAASLAALRSGMDQLYSGDADVALVGAADGMNNAVSFMSFAKTQALSPQGRCRPFSNTADGIALSEGVAALVLKRLQDAERDGDEIYGLVKAVGSSSDGRNRSLTAPHPGGQIDCVRRSYEKAGVAPSTVELVEAHGTGTAVGDKVEIESLATVFGESAKLQHCAVGSVKSMIGHTKMAAGFAGIIKSVLALKHHVLPPTIGVETPNSHVDFEQTPFYINSEARPWLDSDEGHPRRCGVSAFGFGGTNFHAVLEEYTGRYQISEDTDLNPRNAEIFAWSRDDSSEIMHAARRLLETPQLESLELAEVADSVHLAEKATVPPGVQRKSRLALVATSPTDLKQKLESVLRDLPDNAAIDDPNGVYFSKDAVPPGSVCFLFPGQGSQKIGMLRDLVVSRRALQGLFEDADAVLRNDLSKPLSQYMYPLPAFSDEKRQRQKEELDATEVAQPALGVADLAALDTLESFGLHPDFLAGHSYGEYVALCAAGAISREQLIRLSWIRGRIAAKASQTEPGAMAAVQASAETTAKLVNDIGLSVSLASLNAPDQTIIGGSADAIRRAVAALADHRITASQIPVAAAFHTEAMRSAAEALASELAKIDFCSPTTAVFSNTLATAFPEDAGMIRQVLARHIAEPLRFTEQIENLYQAGARVFIEAGPGKVLSGLVDRILGDMPHTTLSIDAPGKPGWQQLAHLLSRALVLGLPVEIDSWFTGRRLSGRTVEQLAQEACHRAKPEPTVWRVNPARAVPWYQSPDDASDSPQEFPGQIQQESAVPTPFTTYFVAQAQVGSPHGRNDMSKYDDRRATSVRPQAVAETTGSEALVSELQRNLTQLIELQKEQQRSMQGLLDMQQQLMSATLRGEAARPVSREPERSLSPDASTGQPSIPKAPQIPVLPSLKIEPGVPAMTAAETSTTPTSGTAGADRPEVTHREAKTVDDDNVPSTDEFKSVLLHSVSERTGYPEQMLNLDAHMEADLGIDSIKLIEIFSTLEDYRARLNGGNIEQSFEELAELKTLGSIVAWYDKNRTRTLEEKASKKKT